MINVGVIGVGAMGSNHARIYSELPEVKLVGIADVNKKTVEIISKKYGIVAFTDYRKLLKKNLDAVSVCTPTSLHEKISIDAIGAGCHVLVEKPISDTIAGARKIIATAKKRNVKLMVGYVERFNPIIPAIKKSIEDSKVISINIIRVGPFPPRLRNIGVVIDLATHDIDLIRYLTDSEPKKVHGFVSSKNVCDYDDAANLIFEMKNGILAQITANWLTPFKVREINVATKEKFIKGWFIEQKVVEYSKYRENDFYTVHELPIRFSEPLKLELKTFIEGIKEDKEVPVSGYDGLKALEIALKLVRKPR